MTETPQPLVTLDKIVSLCKRRGFIFQSSEIYGGLGSTWDYGPLGVELKRNVKEAWWRDNVLRRDDVVGLDSAILMHPRVWEASGHLEGFTDPMVECRVCHHRFREDHVLVGMGVATPGQEYEDFTLTKYGSTAEEVMSAVANRASDLNLTLVVPPTATPLAEIGPSSRASVKCPVCDETALTEPRNFNLMFKTFMGPVEDTASTVYLRPETAQGIFANFLNVLNSTRKKLPFGIAQTGKSFRNEITPGNFVFRTREFEQMEIEFFVRPGEDEAWHQRWIDQRFAWYQHYGIRPQNLRLRPHDADELSHYAKATSDIEYLFPWGWGELEGIANRTDFDLRRHTEFSGERLTYFDEESQQHITPYVIEPSGGVDRAALTFLMDAYTEEEAPTAQGKMEKRVVLKLHPALAPVKVAVLPLSRNQALAPLSRQVFASLTAPGRWPVEFDDAQGIGRRYRRFDEVGAPLCVTIDFDSLDDHQVTVRDRDTMHQNRVPIDGLDQHLQHRLDTSPPRS